jgi:hypothetical protein
VDAQNSTPQSHVARTELQVHYFIQLGYRMAAEIVTNELCMEVGRKRAKGRKDHSEERTGWKYRGLRRLLGSLSMLWVVGFRAVDRREQSVLHTINTAIHNNCNI